MPLPKRNAIEQTRVSGESPRLQSRNPVSDVAGAIGRVLELDRERPAGVRHGNVTALISTWARWSLETTDRLIDPIDQVDRLRSVGRTPGEGLVRRAVAVHEEAFVAGLEARIGRFLVPPVIIEPSVAAEAVKFDTMLALGRRIAGAESRSPVRVEGGPSVCKGCSVVFRPTGRERSALYCRLCRKRPASSNVLGLTRRWEGVPLRAPVIEAGEVQSWETVTIGKCEECGKPVGRRRNKGVFLCASGGCRQRFYRRAS